MLDVFFFTFFYYNKNGEKHIFLEISSYTTLCMLDLFGCGPKLGIFHYGKLPSSKRVK